MSVEELGSLGGEDSGNARPPLPFFYYVKVCDDCPAVSGGRDISDVIESGWDS